MTSVNPKVITKSDPSKVEIEWDDGHKTVYSSAQLRGICPCAACVNELTGVRMHDPKSVPGDMTTTGVELVGLYAIGIAFADGHNTGIFPFSMLRKNDPAGL